MPPTGTVTLEGGYLHIVAPPQVQQRLVKIFIGAKRGTLTNSVIISATDQNCRELQWVRDMFPLQLVGAAIDRVTAGDRKFRDREASIALTRAEGYTPPDAALAVPARQYQLEAADMVHLSGGLLLGDDVGLGKTVSAIATMVRDGAPPVLVVTLTHLQKQWRRELSRFVPDFKVHIVSKSTPYALADIALTDIGPSGKRRIVKSGIRRMPDVVVLNYHKLAGWRDQLIELQPGLVVWDECQELRTGDTSHKGEAAHAIARVAGLRMGLSATPIYNYGGEFWNVMEAIWPGILGSFDEFLAEWCTGTDKKKAKIKEPPVLRAHLIERGAMLRRRRKDVGRELPPLQRNWYTVDVDQTKLDEISKSVAELAEAVLSTDLGFHQRGEAALALDWQLRQATGLAKVRGIIGLVSMILDSDPTERVLLYCHHHLVFDALAAAFNALGYTWAKFTGEESDNQKQRALNEFIDGDARILMMAIRSGAGIDGIQKRCRTVVFGELDWSPGVHIQAEGRAARDGQASEVMAYYVYAEEGSDPVLRDVLGLKESQRAGLVDGDLVDQSGGTTSVDAGAEGGRVKKLAAAYLAKRRGG